MENVYAFLSRARERLDTIIQVCFPGKSFRAQSYNPWAIDPRIACLQGGAVVWWIFSETARNVPSNSAPDTLRVACRGLQNPEKIRILETLHVDSNVEG